MKMSPQYINFARKYRPSNFQQLLGQEALVKTVNYSIINNKLSQAYLLTGIRGVGKTTSARLIAKAVNCTNILVEDNLIVSCSECENCQSFRDHRHPDVIEIDAASKTGVDDIRDIIESSEYRPLIGKYKIFIIDEVHMLSKSAFNALLKILEEPPPHVIFIFATTELQKIPSTIISRCQKYDLRRLTFNEIIQLLEKIVSSEQLNFDNSALSLIAVKSEGSARDAVRLLDQASNLSYSKETKTISLSEINQIIGSVDSSIIIDLLIHIANKDGIKAIELVNEAYKLSSNLENFLQDISHFIAYLSKTKIISNYHDPIYSAFTDKVSDVLVKTSLGKLTVLWQIFNQGLIEVKASSNQLIALEMIVIKAIYSFSFPDPEELIDTNEMSLNASLPRQSSLPVTTQIQVTQEPQEYQESIEPKRGIVDFLGFLHKHNEMEIYYLLFNCVEIKKFDDKVVELISESITNILKDDIKNLLLKWTGEEWDVIVIKQVKQVSLKEQLVSQMHASENWEIIRKHFPSAKISDLLFNN